MSLGPSRIIVTPNTAATELSNSGVGEDVFESYYEYDEEQLSAGGKRQRSDNWTYEDKELLVECVASHPVVEDRSNEKEINIKKNQSWKLISEAMALRGSRKNIGSSTRNPQKVREQWVRLKGKAKSVLRRGRSNSVVLADDSGSYKKGPTPIDYRIKEIFPHLFGTKAEEFDKHSCDSGHFHNGNVSMSGDLSMPASQTIDNLHLGQQNHYAIQTMDNCSQDPPTSNLTHSSSEDNSYSFPPGVSSAGQTNAAYNKMAGIRNSDENVRHMMKREKNMIVASKGKRLGIKRKIPVKMNAFEHLLLQANLKKINLSIKQSEELHRLKMTVQKKESYLLDLKIKKAAMEVESKIQKTEESSVSLSNLGLNQAQIRSQNQIAPSQINLSHNHILSAQNHNQLSSSHVLSTSDHRQINNAQNQLTSSQINSNQNQSLSNQMNSNQIQSVTGQIQSISNPMNTGHNRIVISGQNQPTSSQSHNGQVGLNHGQMNSNQSQVNPHQSQMNLTPNQMTSTQSQMNPTQSQMNPHQSQMNTNSSQINSTQSQMNPTQNQVMNLHRNQMNSNPSQLISNQIQRAGNGGGMSIMELNENLENNSMNGTHPRIMIQRGALHNHHQQI